MSEGATRACDCECEGEACDSGIHDSPTRGSHAPMIAIQSTVSDALIQAVTVMRSVTLDRRRAYPSSAPQSTWMNSSGASVLQVKDPNGWQPAPSRSVRGTARK
eukprot:9471643-Pyramimonas_sp.AAC.2